MHNYKQLKVWQESLTLVTQMYRITKKFPKEELFGITSQIRRAAVSIPANISEGAGRNTNKAFLQFLGIAEGSSNELMTLLLISQNIEYVKPEELVPALTSLSAVQKMIYTFRTKLEKTESNKPV